MITGTLPISSNPTSTSVYVDELSYDPDDQIYNECLKSSGRDWKRYNLLEDSNGFARFHNNLNEPDGNWLTLLWSISSDDAKRILELPSISSGEYKSLCEIKKGAIIWIGKHLSSDNNQIYIENRNNVNFLNSQKT